MMALEVYFKDDIAHGIVSAVVLCIETASAHGQVNCDFVAGVLAMAKSRAMACGVPWSVVIEDARAALGKGDLGGLLESGRVVHE
jgi:hypothetical protein